VYSALQKLAFAASPMAATAMAPMNSFSWLVPSLAPLL